MPAIYNDFTVTPEDDIETRQAKVYLGVTSIGEELYCIGAAVGEMIKQLNRYEKTISDLRFEVRSIREEITDYSMYQALAVEAFHEVADR